MISSFFGIIAGQNGDRMLNEDQSQKQGCVASKFQVAALPFPVEVASTCEVANSTDSGLRLILCQLKATADVMIVNNNKSYTIKGMMVTCKEALNPNRELAFIFPPRNYSCPDSRPVSEINNIYN